ncbi:MAG TPA: bacterial transcriptional activator domain-containing protein [Pyrinomonadaceae bacterium]|jgi:DNA-binding SARP family transcriptional activator
MATLSISLFGKFSARTGEQILDGFDSCKVQELFSYLLLHREHSHPRETLAGLLWGDNSTTQSKKYLRQTLWHLQIALSAHEAQCEHRVLLIEPGWVQINTRADLLLDVAAFELGFASVQKKPGRELDDDSARMMREAVSLYQGDLLEGWYQDWCLYKREQLQNIYLTMLDKLMGYCEAHHQYEEGLDYGARILRFDRASERTHRRLMRLQYLAEDRTAALRQYERCVAALKEELGVRPAKRTVMLYEQISADHLEEALQPTTENGFAAAPTSMLPEVLGRLRQLQEALADMQRQVRQSIQSTELALKSRR